MSLVFWEEMCALGRIEADIVGWVREGEAGQDNDAASIREGQDLDLGDRKSVV